jgi:hypothetical protein
MRTGAYCIWIVSKPDRLHNYGAFDEHALSLRHAFAELGYDAPITLDPRQLRGTPIVFGAHLLERLNMPPHARTIIYNTEQVHPDSIWIKPQYLDILKRYTVWDYSRRNIEVLRTMGVEATWCGLGYAPELTRITPTPEKDIDVLFVGNVHSRRHRILDALHQAGVNVMAVRGQCWAEQRDALFARAKIVINIHMYDAHILEMFRVSYLLANRICVVSETGQDHAIEDELQGGIAFAPYDKLVETCIALLADDAARDRIADTGFNLFSAMSQTPMLADALKASRSA